MNSRIMQVKISLSQPLTMIEVKNKEGYLIHHGPSRKPTIVYDLCSNCVVFKRWLEESDMPFPKTTLSTYTAAARR